MTTYARFMPTRSADLSRVVPPATTLPEQHQARVFGALQEAMRRLDASRCNPVASESETDRAPHRNGDTGAGTQPLVN